MLKDPSDPVAVPYLVVTFPNIFVTKAADHHVSKTQKREINHLSELKQIVKMFQSCCLLRNFDLNN